MIRGRADAETKTLIIATEDRSPKAAAHEINMVVTATGISRMSGRDAGGSKTVDAVDHIHPRQMNRHVRDRVIGVHQPVAMGRERLHAGEPRRQDIAQVGSDQGRQEEMHTAPNTADVVPVLPVNPAPCHRVEARPHQSEGGGNQNHEADHHQGGGANHHHLDQAVGPGLAVVTEALRQEGAIGVDTAMTAKSQTVTGGMQTGTGEEVAAAKNGIRVDDEIAHLLLQPQDVGNKQTIRKMSGARHDQTRARHAGKTSFVCWPVR